MKKGLILIFLCSVIHSQAQLIEEKDTLYLNYFIAAGELGGKNEGLIIHRNGDKLNARSVRYNNSSYGMALKKDDIIRFYKENHSNYTIIKEDWVLSMTELEYIKKLLDEIKVRPVKENAYSNAGEHYTILTRNESYVFIDRTGNWNKFLEVKKNLDIEQYP